MAAGKDVTVVFESYHAFSSTAPKYVLVIAEAEKIFSPTCLLVSVFRVMGVANVTWGLNVATFVSLLLLFCFVSFLYFFWLNPLRIYF